MTSALRAFIPTGHSFEGQYTARLRNLDTVTEEVHHEWMYYTLHCGTKNDISPKTIAKLI